MRLRFALPLIVLTAFVPAGSALGGVVGNPADRLANKPLDDYAYDLARDCR